MGFTEYDSRNLLLLLHKYVTTYGSDAAGTVPELAADLAMSLDVTDDIDDQRRREIEQNYV